MALSLCERRLLSAVDGAVGMQEGQVVAGCGTVLLTGCMDAQEGGEEPCVC